MTEYEFLISCAIFEALIVIMSILAIVYGNLSEKTKKQIYSLGLLLIALPTLVIIYIKEILGVEVKKC